MTDPAASADALEDVFRSEWPMLVAIAARVTDDLGRAEEIVQDAMVSALARWPFTGVPDRPGAWLLTATRNRARNVVRDASRERARLQARALVAPDLDLNDEADVEAIPDDRLRLVFLCCHPLLSTEAQVALTLRLVGGLSTRQIARAFVQPEATVAQRIVRAKRTLADAQVQFELPEDQQWSDRLPAVLGVVYLIFNEGHLAAEGRDLVRPELCVEALRLGRLLAALVPEHSEVHGLLALMELQAARLPARVDNAGDLVRLADQDRSLWDRARIDAGRAALARAVHAGPSGPLTLQAAIAECHISAERWDATDWDRIVALYDELLEVAPSPVAALNRSVAVAMATGPDAGLASLAPVVAGGDLDDYHLLWATRADFLHRAGRPQEAAREYRRALTLATNGAERRFLADRLMECERETHDAS